MSAPRKLPRMRGALKFFGYPTVSSGLLVFASTAALGCGETNALPLGLAWHDLGYYTVGLALVAAGLFVTTRRASTKNAATAARGTQT